MKILGYAGIGIGICVASVGVLWIDFLRLPEVMRHLALGMISIMLGAICLKLAPNTESDTTMQ